MPELAFPESCQDPLQRSAPQESAQYCDVVALDLRTRSIRSLAVRKGERRASPANGGTCYYDWPSASIVPAAPNCVSSATVPMSKIAGGS